MPQEKQNNTENPSAPGQIKINAPQKESSPIESGLLNMFRKSKKEVEGYEEGLNAARRVYFPLILLIAISSDFSDPFPVYSKVIKLIALPIIWYNLYIVGSPPGYLDEKYKVEVSFKLKILIRILGLTDLIPFISVIPLTTLSVLIHWFKTQQLIEEKEKEKFEEEEKSKNLGKQISYKINRSIIFNDAKRNPEE